MCHGGFPMMGRAAYGVPICGCKGAECGNIKIDVYIAPSYAQLRVLHYMFHILGFLRNCELFSCEN